MKSENESKVILQQQGSLRQPLSKFLFSAHPSITDIAGSRRAQFSSILAFALTCTTGISLIFVGRAGMDATFLIQAALTVLSLLAYITSRLPRYVWGSIILVSSLSLSGFANILSGSDDPATAIYTTILVALVIGSALLPVWGNVAQFVGSVLGILVLPIVYPAYTFSDAGDTLVVVVSIGILLIVAQIFRNSLESMRLEEVQTANQELRELGSTLEQRVAARTKDLEIVAEVGTATATILQSERLLQEVVDLTKARFNLYHSHIYLLDQTGENLVLTAGAGEPGRQMIAKGLSIRLDREQSLVARAARERKGVTVNDVTESPDFLPNPLLPDTRSELAVPMIVSNNVIGVFDIQSEQVGRFTESDVNIQTTLAAQLATSIQNVRSFEQSRKQAELQSLVNMIGSRIQRTTSIEEALQTAIRELGVAVGATRVQASIAGREDNGGEFSRSQTN